MKWLYFVAALLVLSGGGYAVYQKTRGLRNNNPGNIRHGSPWEGLSNQQTDEAFAQFVDPLYGIRALNKILKTYYQKYNLATVRDIISRWAPSNENDTESYIQSVALALNVSPDEPLNVRQVAPELTKAIIYHENGMQPYEDSKILAGVSLGWA